MLKLLIVDDQASVHTFLMKTMNWSSLGIHDVQHAYDGEEAARMLESYRPDLLLMDIRMPGLTGIEVLKGIRGELSHKPKTIILSAYDQFEYAREALRLHVSQYLLKPVDTSLMQEALKELVQELQAAARSALVQEIERADLTGSYPVACAKAAEVCRVYGVHSSIVASAKGLGPTVNLCFQDRDHSPIIAFPLLYREARGECVYWLGLKEEIALNGLEELFQAEIEAGRAFAFGYSGESSASRPLPSGILESRQAAGCSFYTNSGVYRYQAGMFAGPEEVEQLRQIGASLAMKWPGITINAMQRWLEQLEERRVNSDAVYEMVYPLWRVMAGPPKNREGCEPNLEDLRGSFKHFHELKLHMQELAAVALSESPHIRETLHRIKPYLEAHMAEDLSLQTVSDLFHIDKYRLSREFKLLFEENYWQYVTRIRLEKAAFYLKETAWKNSEIAERTGYADESHLSKAFKKHYGLSPKEYRSQCND